jgi:23S rRNA (pseudouridine1915-N3)-methyltransferase
VKIIFIQVGKTNQAYLREGISIFETRIRHYIPLQVITIPERKGVVKKGIESLKDSEGDQLLSNCRQGDYIILLDERGDQLDSREFAVLIDKQMVAGMKRILFISGGAYGVSRKVYDRANRVLSLSKMTFSHQMIRLIFFEQLYRAMTILKGDPYHHG